VSAGVRQSFDTNERVWCSEWRGGGSNSLFISVFFPQKSQGDAALVLQHQQCPSATALEKQMGKDVQQELLLGLLQVPKETEKNRLWVILKQTGCRVREICPNCSHRGRKYILHPKKGAQSVKRSGMKILKVLLSLSEVDKVSARSFNNGDLQQINRKGLNDCFVIKFDFMLLPPPVCIAE